MSESDHYAAVNVDTGGWISPHPTNFTGAFHEGDQWARNDTAGDYRVIHTRTGITIPRPQFHRDTPESRSPVTNRVVGYRYSGETLETDLGGAA